MRNRILPLSRPLRLLTALGGAAVPFLLGAQVSLYEFSQNNTTYTPITSASGGFVLGTPAFFPPSNNLVAYVDPAVPAGTPTWSGYLTPAIGPGYPIGFNFTYNGDTYDRIGIANGGWISFGRSQDLNTAVWTFTSDHQAGRPLSHSYGGPPEPYQRNRIAGWGSSNLRAQDQSSVGGPISSLRVATIGTAPNRTCVIQWADFRASYSTDGNRINFQIRLNEADNSVEVVFGQMEWLWSTGAGAPQIGLGGRTNEDYNNRMTVWEEPFFAHDWNQTVAGADSASYCVAGNPSAPQAAEPGVYPAVGLSFKWTPVACPPPVWPLTLTDVTFHSATASWSTIPDAVSYDYVVTMENDPSAPPVSNGNTLDTFIQLEDLQPRTTYYIFVRTDCGATSGTWGLATILLTEGGAFLECGAPALVETHCSSTYSTVTWHYSTSDGSSPVRILFDAGFVGSSGGPIPSFRIWNGGPADTTAANLLFPVSGTGTGDVMPGQMFTSTGNSIFMKLITDMGSCETQPWYTPFEWTVGCMDCIAPLSNFLVVNEDCATLEYDVRVSLASLGTATSLTVANTQGVAETEISTIGVHDVGPFTAGTPVTITLVNPDNALCNVSSLALINDPCAVVDCGPTDYTYCYEELEELQWLYQGEDQAIGIRWRSGSVGMLGTARIYDGSDPFTVIPEEFDGPVELANVMRHSTNDDDNLLLELSAGELFSCVNGYATGWDYVISCYDGCTQPEATFAVVHDCDNQEFSVTVTITEIGSAGTVSITNNAGAPAVTATAAGTYTVGPFDSQEVVDIEVEGASVLCSWTSPHLTFDCTGIGMAELGTHTLKLFPNPNTGLFRIALPENMDGALEVQVLDIAGRMVAEQAVPAGTKGEVTIDVEHLPNGVYHAVLGGTGLRYTGTFNIAR